ncbi:MAG: glycosyltransferase family 4 protein [Symploca sp. SIO1C2]|nr:glycosyltransferase family 4 protein [Symploca sp. SIO1C2]
MGSVGTLIIKTAPDNLQIEHISTWDGELSRESNIHLFKAFLRALTTFLGKLVRGEVDIVHIHLAERGSALRKAILALVAMAFNKPFIMHAHGCEFHSFHSQLPVVQKKLLNWVLQQSAYLVALSESWRDYYVNNCGLTAKQVIVFPNPAEIPEYVPDRTNSQQKIKIAFLGRICKRKGVFDLLEAFAQLSPEHQEKSKLILAGIGELEEAKALTERLEIKQHVTFPGWVNPDERNELLSDADVFLLPSYNEGLPMAVLEAMSWGLPVVTTPVGGIPELITNKETGLLVDPGNIPQLAEALESLITNEPLRLELGKAARKRVAPLDIKLYSRSLSELYFSVSGTSKSQSVEPPLKEAVTASRRH